MKLSIITINYNNFQGLKKTMESVFSQTFSDYEYIIIDGSSNDGSGEYIRKYSDNLAYWVSESDSGIYNAMNKGIEKSNGAYLLFLNSGDYFYSEESLNKLFENSNGEDIIYGNILVHTSSQDYIKTYPGRLSFEYFLKDTLPHPASLIRKELFDRAGLYNERNKIVSDWEFFLNAICRDSVQYKYVNELITAFYLDGFSSQTENITLIQKERKLILDKSYGAFLADYENYEKCKIELTNYTRSRLHHLASKLSASRIIKLLKSF